MMRTGIREHGGFRHPITRAFAAMTLLAWIVGVVAMVGFALWRQECPAPSPRSAEGVAAPAVFVGVLAGTAGSALPREAVGAPSR